MAGVSDVRVTAEILGRTEWEGMCEGKTEYRCSREITKMLSVFNYKSNPDTYISLMLLFVRSLGSYTSDYLLSGRFKKNSFF